MKKLKTQVIAFAFLAIASIAAYAYIGMVNPQPNNKALYGVGQDTPEEQVSLPDVEMVNKIIDAGKKLKAFGK